LQAWRLVYVDSSVIRLAHHDEVGVELHFAPSGCTLKRVELSLLENNMEDAKRTVTMFFFERLGMAVQSSEERDARTVLRRISTMWTYARRLRTEIELVAVQYPVSVQLNTKKSRKHPFLRAIAHIHAYRARASYSVVYELTGEEILEDHGDIENVTDGVGCNVEVRFGEVE
jgi:Ser-tRNA(Ala) deacylase AlaX